MSVSLILQLIISGILIGAIYAMISLGLSLIWGVSRIINVAHGEFIIIGAYVTYLFSKSTGADPFWFVPVSGIVVGIVGVIIQLTLFNKIIGKEELISLILSFGISIFLGGLMLILFTADPRFLTTKYTSEAFHLGNDLIIKKGDFWGLIISAIVFTGTYLYMDKTDTGKAIQAVAQDKDAALLMGIDEKRIYIIAMFISAFIAGISGGLVGILYTFTPFSGGSFLGWSFAITVLAGLGTIHGVLVAGIIIGLARALTTSFATGMQASVGFIIMIIVMLFRPKGLFGKVE